LPRLLPPATIAVPSACSALATAPSRAVVIAGLARIEDVQDRYNSVEESAVPADVPPAISTWLLFGSSKARCPLRGVDRVAEEVVIEFVTGSKTSRDPRSELPLFPPARRTVPSISV